MVGPHGFEFCRINYENFNGREHRYIWGNGFGTMIPDKIMKVDTHTKEWKIWKEEVRSRDQKFKILKIAKILGCVSVRTSVCQSSGFY